MVVIICNLFIQLINSLESKIPFTIVNAVSMRNCGIVCMVVSAIYPAISYWMLSRVEPLISVKDIRFYPSYDFDYPLLFIGLVFIVLSEILRQGIQIQQENELTV
jgi:hypothetical protein